MDQSAVRKPHGTQVCYLPDASEIFRLRSLPKDKRPTFQVIADRYGVSRQAVWKALDKWIREQKKLAS
jgi:predicted DNA-binding protein (UPF0251 family)